jgi:hypothetical protein
MLPSRSPDSTSRTTVPLFLIRAISSSSPGFRKFLVHLVKQLWGDPKRLGKFLDQWFSPAASRVNPLRVLPIPKAPEFPDIMRLLQALLRKATVQAVLVATATLMVIHLSRARPVEDDDEGALLQRRLPLFVRDGVWRIIAPRGPLPTLRWPPRTWTADAMEALRFDLRRREMDHSDLTLHRYLARFASPPSSPARPASSSAHVLLLARCASDGRQRASVSFVATRSALYSSPCSLECSSLVN